MFDYREREKAGASCTRGNITSALAAPPYLFIYFDFNIFRQTNNNFLVIAEKDKEKEKRAVVRNTREMWSGGRCTRASRWPSSRERERRARNERNPPSPPPPVQLLDDEKIKRGVEY